MTKETKLTKSARGQQCQIRIPGVCNFDSSTVVLAHKNGGGAGMKSPDWLGAYACFECHRFVDGGYVEYGADRDTALLYHYEGIFRTQELMVAQGFITIMK